VKPNVRDQYDISNLHPVIKEPEREDYLLTDAENRFYIWSLNDSALHRVTEDLFESEDTAIYLMNGFRDQDV
jgi:hypothetical protein